MQEHGNFITIYSQTALGKLYITLVETYALFLVHRNPIGLDMDRLVTIRFQTPTALTEQQQGDMQIVYQDSQHLLGLINDLLDISQIEAGLMELEFQEVDLSKLIHSVMATVSALVRDKDVELHEEVAPDLPVVQADTARIRQVLLRLLANAAKFTERGSITVRAWTIDGEVMVSVSDTGIGIPSDDRERIFGRFEQGTTADGRRPGGAGLGLALSKEFVEMHGGQVWVESEVGKGSTFTFSLPTSHSSTP